MPFVRHATERLHSLGGEALKYYISYGPWGYAVMPKGRFNWKVKAKAYDTAQEAIDAFDTGERPTIERLTDG